MSLYYIYYFSFQVESFWLVGGLVDLVQSDQQFMKLNLIIVGTVEKHKLLMIFKGDLTTIIIFHRTHQCFIQVQTPLEYSECLSGLAEVGSTISLYLTGAQSVYTCDQSHSHCYCVAHSELRSEIQPSEPNEEPGNHSLFPKSGQGWETIGCSQYQIFRR